jgi:cephalosporin hydroxylase
MMAKGVSMVRSIKAQAAQALSVSLGRAASGDPYKMQADHEPAVMTARCLHLFHNVLPASMIDIGKAATQTSVMLRNIARTYGAETQMLSFGRDAVAENQPVSGIMNFHDPVIGFDTPSMQKQLEDLPRPWILSTGEGRDYQSVLSVLGFARQHLLKGDWLVIEKPILQQRRINRPVSFGPRRALRQFLSAHPGVLAQDRSYDQMFGKRAAANTPIFLRRI